MLQLRVNPLALQDLRNIKEYILHESGDPVIATETVSEIVTNFESLVDFPMLGADLSRRIQVPTDYRYLVTGKYIVFYKVEKHHISVYRVLHARQDYINVLFSADNDL